MVIKYRVYVASLPALLSIVSIMGFNKINMNKFARLFELDDHQVLLMKDYDDEEEKFYVSQTTWIDSISYSMRLGMKNEESRDKYFDKYNEEEAKRYVTSVTNLLA